MINFSYIIEVVKLLIPRDNKKMLHQLLICDYISRRPNSTRMDVQIYLHESSETSWTSKKKDGDTISLERNRVVGQWLDELVDEDLLASRLENNKLVYYLADRFAGKEFDKTKWVKNIYLLEEWKTLFNSYPFLPYKSDIEAFIEAFKSDDEDHINFIPLEIEKKTTNPVSENLNKIYGKIVDKSEISFRYKGFSDSTSKQIKNFQPYLIKEHKQLWYVVGLFRDTTDFKIFAIDRIVGSIDFNSNAKEFERIDFDFNKLTEHSLGIHTSWQNSDKKVDKSTDNILTTPLRISFKLKNGDKFDNIPYLKVNPIHASQKITEQSKDGYVTVKLVCYPSADLMREIRKFGKHNVMEIKVQWKDPKEANNQDLPDLEKWIWEL